MSTAVAVPAPPKRINRLAHLRWVTVADMVVSSVAQREQKAYRVDQIIAEYDEDKIGTPILSHRDGHYFIVDGQHRMAATAEARGEDTSVQCWVYEGLNETDEAELFLRYNDVLAVKAYDKFAVGVQAERPTETDVDRIVRSQGLCVSKDKIPGAIHAVSTLTRVYNRDGAPALAQALAIIRDSFGDSGFQAPVIDGVGLMCGRYNSQLEMDTVVQRLGKVNGGVNGLLGKAEVLRRQTGHPKGHCVAAAVVEIVNLGRGGKKLPTWWKTEA